MDITIRDPGCAAEPFLFWDTIWNAAEGIGAWALAGADERGNIGGLQATSPLTTAVINALFTNRRCPDDHPLRVLAGDDPQGWWGDGVDVRADLFEQPEGSLLWLLERATATEENARWAQAFAAEALAPLQRCGAVARIECRAEAFPERRMILLDVALYGRDGRARFAEKFDVIWQSLR